MSLPFLNICSLNGLVLKQKTCHPPQQTIVKKMNIDAFSHINKSALPDTSKSDKAKEDRNIWHGILSLVRLQKEISVSKVAPIAIYGPEKRQNHRAL